MGLQSDEGEHVINTDFIQLTFVLGLKVLNVIDGYLSEEEAPVLVPVSVIWGNVFIVYLT